MIQIGDVFGRLTVIAEAPRRRKHRMYTSQCSCGKQTTSFAFSLTAGDSKSCGCIAAEKSKDRWKNGNELLRKRLSESAANASHRMSKHPAFRSWSDMRQRCHKENHKWFPSYGGRGISVSTEWRASFEAFWSDMGCSWFKGAQIGRKDNDGMYCKENCRWETAKQQQNNKSNNVHVTTPSGVMTVSQAAEKYCLTHGCISYRAKQGYSPENLVKPSERSKQC